MNRSYMLANLGRYNQLTAVMCGGMYFSWPPHAKQCTNKNHKHQGKSNQGESQKIKGAKQ